MLNRRFVLFALVAVFAALEANSAAVRAQSSEFDDDFGDRSNPELDAEFDIEFEGELEEESFDIEDEEPADTRDEEPAAAADEEATARIEPVPAEPDTDHRFRLHNTWYGATGGVWVVDAGSAPSGTFRTQLALDFFFSEDFLESGDTNDYLGGALSFSWTMTDFLELYASIESSSNSNDKEQPRLFQVLGDTTLGLKGYYEIVPWAIAGADLRVSMLNSVGEIGPTWDGTGFGIRGNAAFDLRRIGDPLPLVARFNLDYFFDNSSQVIESIEARRFEALDDALQNPDWEDRHLLSRIERFALGINRTDMLTIALGVEAPLTLDTDFHIHPLLEWQWGIPVNRQGYSCLHDEAAVSAGGDGCLNERGVSSFPQSLTLGARVYPFLRGVGLLVAADIGLTGTSDFVRELAPTRPYAVIIALSFAYGDRPPAREIRRVEVARDAAPQRGRVRGTIVEAGSGTPVANAIVSYPGRELTAQRASGDGLFVSYELDPGAVEFRIEHPDYETGTCLAVIPSPPDAAPSQEATSPDESQTGTSAEPREPETGEGDASSASSGNETPAEKAVTSTDQTAPASAAPSGSGSANEANRGTVVEMRCELVARPRLGSIRGRVGSAPGIYVSGAKVEISGALTRAVVSDATGLFGIEEVPPGTYSVRAEADGYFVKQESVTVVAGDATKMEIRLIGKPARSMVSVGRREIRIRRKIHFVTNSAEIDSQSEPLLAEIADVLIRKPEIRQVEIQGHTDNRGRPSYNLDLSRRRAEAVRNWLIESGVASSRLQARGYGQERPLAPNITRANRARNRRVQFIIREQD
jgi:outer membrane protein OmpA-like peptidoglycan-associated protein